MKGWIPWINEDGFAEDFHEYLDAYLLQEMPSNFEEVESCILRAAEEADIRQSSKCKSRVSDEVVKLIQKRRIIKDKEQRKIPTKLIRKHIIVPVLANKSVELGRADGRGHQKPTKSPPKAYRKST